MYVVGSGQLAAEYLLIPAHTTSTWKTDGVALPAQAVSQGPRTAASSVAGGGACPRLDGR
jgi:hypothetical protein